MTLLFVETTVQDHRDMLMQKISGVEVDDRSRPRS